MNVENDIIQTELIEKDILLNRKCFIRFLMDKNNIRLYINIFYKTFQVFSFNTSKTKIEMHVFKIKTGLVMYYFYRFDSHEITFDVDIKFGLVTSTI